MRLITNTCNDWYVLACISSATLNKKIHQEAIKQNEMNKKLTDQEDLNFVHSLDATTATSTPTARHTT